MSFSRGDIFIIFKNKGRCNSHNLSAKLIIKILLSAEEQSEDIFITVIPKPSDVFCLCHRIHSLLNNIFCNGANINFTLVKIVKSVECRSRFVLCIVFQNVDNISFIVRRYHLSEKECISALMCHLDKLILWDILIRITE